MDSLISIKHPDRRVGIINLPEARVIRQAFKSKRANVNEIHFWRKEEAIHLSLRIVDIFRYSELEKPGVRFLRSQETPPSLLLGASFAPFFILFGSSCYVAAAFRRDASHLSRMRLLFPPKCFEMRNATLRSCLPMSEPDVKSFPHYTVTLSGRIPSGSRSGAD
ncbi:hypothetical protein AVEN_243860-1 [Araneus ventricosus]|uniref:Uncharacterized protein n=1 Tax=Araneus ventricosus TaxID=182803 RepID=A0A4Y2A6T7_ARAVE|nr:hypothetical protein AVEN_243860-1 [Araneus ventricosus]